MRATIAIAILCLSATMAPAQQAPEADGAVVDAAPIDEPEVYFPPWHGVEPLQVLHVRHNPELTDEENGAFLTEIIPALQPGQMLVIGGGRYCIGGYFNIALNGTAEAPIWIVAAEGQTPIITRPDAKQNTINVGGRGTSASYLCLRGLEITGGSQLLRLHNCNNVWIDGCHLHHGRHGAITANTADTHHLYLTRNEIHHPGGPEGTNEGMYLGANNGRHVMRDSIVALNYVHDIGVGTQGDGIEVKGGSHSNWIVANVVRDTRYPCILVYGAGGKGPNIIERNICLRSGNYAMQVTGEAIVRNNLVIGGEAGAFGSTDNQGTTRDLQVVHNTFVNTGVGANLTSWSDREGLVFANNAVYSRDAASIRFPNGSEGVTLAGNVVFGEVVGSGGGFTRGNGLTDFLDVTWEGTACNATPAEGSALIGAADPRFAVERDLTGQPRVEPLDAGAYDARE